MSNPVVYAIVKAGGRQEKVSVGDVVVVDKLAGEIGDEVSLAPVMLVHRPLRSRLSPRHDPVNGVITRTLVP